MTRSKTANVLMVIGAWYSGRSLCVEERVVVSFVYLSCVMNVA